MGRRVIRLNYDIVSPWSYLAYVVLKRYRTIWDYDLELNPAWLGGVMSISKNSPPFKVPLKQKKMVQEIPMIGKFYGVKCIVPPNFPFNTLGIMRFLKVVNEKDPSQLEYITDKFYEAIYKDEMKVENIDLIFDTITPKPYSREKIEEYLEVSKSDEIKQAVKQDTIKLTGEGAFGFPWIDVLDSNGNHLTIFGSDRFEFLAHWLGEEWKGPNPHFHLPKSHL